MSKSLAIKEKLRIVMDSFVTGFVISGQESQKILLLKFEDVKDFSGADISTQNVPHFFQNIPSSTSEPSAWVSKR